MLVGFPPLPAPLTVSSPGSLCSLEPAKENAFFGSLIFVFLHSLLATLSPPFRQVWLAIQRVTVTRPDVPGQVHEVVVAVIPGASERLCLRLWPAIGTGSQLVDLGRPPSLLQRTTPPTTLHCPLRFTSTACPLASAEVGGPFVDASNSSDSWPRCSTHETAEPSTQLASPCRESRGKTGPALQPLELGWRYGRVQSLARLVSGRIALHSSPARCDVQAGASCSPASPQPDRRVFGSVIRPPIQRQGLSIKLLAKPEWYCGAQGSRR